MVPFFSATYWVKLGSDFMGWLRERGRRKEMDQARKDGRTEQVVEDQAARLKARREADEAANEIRSGDDTSRLIDRMLSRKPPD